jgi:two-component system LytT family sensor kinase
VPRRLAFPLLIVALSTAAGVYFASQLHYAYSDGVPWSTALAINLAYYWVWGALTPVVIALGARFPLEGRRWPASLLAHTVLGALLTCVQIFIAASILALSDVTMDYTLGTTFLSRALRVNFHSSYPTYWVILFAYLSYDYSAKYRDRALLAARLEARLSEARLAALRMQLNPHFLFNTLNSISSLMYSDVAAADAMMTRLSELLRMTLEADGRPEVTLRQELDVIRRYVEIEKIRFEDRLQVSLDVDDAALDACLPAFALQPLVENAIRHAIAPRAEGGHLAISARRANGTLEIALVDDGPGLPAGALREGVGLGNTRARLKQLYGSEQRLELMNLPQGGLRVLLSLPFRTAE